MPASSFTCITVKKELYDRLRNEAKIRRTSVASLIEALTISNSITASKVTSKIENSEKLNTGSVSQMLVR